MTWSYSGDPTTSMKDAVRFTIGDTDGNHQLLQDEEIYYIVLPQAEGGLAVTNVYWAGKLCADKLAARFAPSTQIKLGDWSGDYQQRYQQFRQMSIDLEQMVAMQAKPFFGGTQPLEPEHCTPKRIKIGMWEDHYW